MAGQGPIASHIDLSIGRVSNLQAQGVITKGADLDTARIEYIRYLREAAQTRHGGAASDVNEERARLIHHQANIAGIDEEERVGNLIAADEVESKWTGMAMAMRAKMLGVPKKVASTALGETDYTAMENMVEEYVREALDELSELSDGK